MGWISTKIYTSELILCFTIKIKATVTNVTKSILTNLYLINPVTPE